MAGSSPAKTKKGMQESGVHIIAPHRIFTAVTATNSANILRSRFLSAMCAVATATSHCRPD
jgi:hypothetical protein